MAITCPPGCIEGTPLWELYDVTDENPEFCLYESIMMEYVDIAGFPVMYYRAKTKMDRLYGEDPNQNFYEPVRTKLYYEPTDEPNVIDMFGIRSDETLEYTLIPKGTFARDVVGLISGVPYTIVVVDAGTGYKSRQSVPTLGGTGEGLRVDVTANVDGVLTKVKINGFNKGSGYTDGDLITIDCGNGDAQFIIENMGIEEAIPMPGDVIKTLWNNRNYEIVDTGAESNIFSAKKLIWEFILRPFRFSEQSLKAEQIHRTSVGWTYVYVHPDGDLADVTYANGVELVEVPIDTLDLGLEGLECGYKYKRNEDGSVEMMREELLVEPDIFPHPTYENTSKPLENKLVGSYGDNVWIETESNRIDNYGDIDSVMFSYPPPTPIVYGVSSNPVITQLDVNNFSLINAQDGETYQLQFSLNNSYLYIVVPIHYNKVQYTLNGLIVGLEESTGNFMFNGETYTCIVNKSQYRINGNVEIKMSPEV